MLISILIAVLVFGIIWFLLGQVPAEAAKFVWIIKTILIVGAIVYLIYLLPNVAGSRLIK